MDKLRSVSASSNFGLGGKVEKCFNLDFCCILKIFKWSKVTAGISLGRATLPLLILQKIKLEADCLHSLPF